MAQKKVPSIQDGLKVFKDAMRRASLSDYSYVNKIILSKNQKDKSILVVPETELWKIIIDDEELKPQIKPLDLTSPADNLLMPLFTYADDLEAPGWFEIDPEIMMSGKVLKIRIDGFEYDVTINKDCLPLKLKKAEFNNIMYKVFVKPAHILAIKKYFPFAISDGGFTMIRLFKII